MKKEITYVKGTAKPIIFSGWWLRVCKYKPESEFSMRGLKYATHEFYVPWWALPLELVYRMVFGTAKLSD